MSFSIICDKCKQQQSIKNFHTQLKEIDLLVNMDSFDAVSSFELWCQNKDCNNAIEVEY